MEIKIKKLREDAIIPSYANTGDAGMDLYTVESFDLEPMERKTIPLGFAVEMPHGYAGLIWDKSGLSHKYGIKTFGGVIDSGYRGEWHVGVMNLSNRFFRFEKGQKVAQLLIQKIETVELKETKTLSNTERGQKGFGSSGR